jgi:hypothetical protein
MNKMLTPQQYRICLLLTFSMLMQGCISSPKLVIVCPNGRPARGATVVVLPPKDIYTYIFDGDVNPPPFRDFAQYKVGSDGTVPLAIPAKI